jgi:hypothetical protein
MFPGISPTVNIFAAADFKGGPAPFEMLPVSLQSASAFYNLFAALSISLALSILSIFLAYLIFTWL